MAQLKVFWTATAIRQRNRIFEYWNERNKSNSYSRKLNTMISDRLSLLKNQPKLGKQVEFDDVRIISLRHYSILYKYNDSQILVVSFWDNRQEPKNLLLLLQNNVE